MMKAVIIGSELAFAEKVHGMLLRVGRQESVQIHWVVKFWPLKALNEIALQEELLEEALEAHLIVLPANLTQSSTHWLVGWLGRWAKQRQVAEAAVGLICDQGDGNIANPLCRELSLLIQAHSLNLIMDLDFVLRNQQKLSIDFAPERETLLPIAQGNSADSRTYNWYRGMGINE